MVEEEEEDDDDDEDYNDDDDEDNEDEDDDDEGPPKHKVQSLRVVLMNMWTCYIYVGMLHVCVR